MFQVYVLNVLSVFRRMLQVFYLDVAYISHICCKCFIWMLHMFAMVFKCFASVSDVCCKSFNYFERMLQVFDLDVVKKDLSVAHVAIGLTCCSCLLQLLGCHLGSPCGCPRLADASAARIHRRGG
jgi:hypothetical protein